MLGGQLDAATDGRDEVGDIVAHKEAVGELGELGDRAGSRHDCRETERRRDQATFGTILRGAAQSWRIAYWERSLLAYKSLRRALCKRLKTC